MQARSQVFRFAEQNKFLGGKIFVFVICLKHIFLSQRNLSPTVVTGLGRGTKKVEDRWSIRRISKVRTDLSNIRAKRSACESKNEVKQIYLHQCSVALSLIASCSVLKISRTGQSCTMDGNHTAVAQQSPT